jgi:hypothetical protein
MKKIDLLNFFYSIGAVVILLGVIAKFLEWESQDTLLLAGLSMEALVFTFSSIQYKKTKTDYKWENIFPELILNDSIDGTVLSQKNIKILLNKYESSIESNLNSLEFLNHSIIITNNKYHESILKNIELLENNNKLYSIINNTLNETNEIYSVINSKEKELFNLLNNIIEISENMEKTKIPLDTLKESIYSLSVTLTDFKNIGKGILEQFNKK